MDLMNDSLGPIPVGPLHLVQSVSYGPMDIMNDSLGPIPYLLGPLHLVQSVSYGPMDIMNDSLGPIPVRATSFSPKCIIWSNGHYEYFNWSKNFKHQVNLVQ